MIFASAIGILSAIVILIAMSRIDIKKFVGYPASMDILVTMLLIYMLHGSYVGMVAAVIGGLVFSGAITVIRKAYGYKRLKRVGLKLVWIDYPPIRQVKLPKLNYKLVAGAIVLMLLIF